MTTDRDDGRSRWVLRGAVAGSLLVHALAFSIYGLAAQRVTHLRFTFARPTPSPEAVVTISNAVTIEKRARPQPEPRPRRGVAPGARAAAPAPLRVAAVPQPLTVPAPVVPRSLPESRALHELAKEQPTAPANPARTVEATAEPQHVALAQRPSAASAASALSQARVARMNETFNRTLAELRRESSPLVVKPETPAAPKRYRMEMTGIGGDLHHGEGYYYPIKSWKADGFDYYYVSYDFTWADGTFESGGVPWPIRFRPRDDPFAHPGNATYDHTPLPGPLPGWALPAGEKVGKALAPFLSPDAPAEHG